MTKLTMSKILFRVSWLFVAMIWHFTATGQSVVKQAQPVPAGFCINNREMELSRMINDYRKLNKLPAIPLSKSLSYVAALHAKDLYFNHPDQGGCNVHSWSNKGKWTAFCYPKDETKKTSAWDKPRELTRYPSRGYEIVYWENNPVVDDTIIMVWKTEEYFNNFLLNTGKWSEKKWNAIGIAIYENYACAWFGEESDPEGRVFVCGTSSDIPVMDTVRPAMPASAKKETSPVPKDSKPAVYYIIVKTNISAGAAKELVNSLKNKEYPEAKVLETEGKIRISVFESSDKASAMTKLKEVKRTVKDAWLLKQ
jgi:hypothetical protein